MTSESLLRLSCFLSVLFCVALAEYLFPKRTLHFSKITRWWRNFSLVVVNSVAVHVLMPVTAVSCSLFVASKGWGVFNWFSPPPFIAWLSTLIVLDVIIYFQHRLFHSWKPLWRLHRVHHVDLDLDVSTALRFHPLEILVSMVIKVVVVTTLGAPLGAVILFEIILNAAAMFNHGNISFPSPVDTLMRKFVVTPDMHRVHHSVIPIETNSNYGFSISLWDYLFATYRAQPKSGHEQMNIGLKEYTTFERHHVLYLLLLPFRR